MAFHCVPHEIEPGIEKFWLHLKRKLQTNGKRLLLVSTTGVNNSEIEHIRVPFTLPLLKYTGNLDPVIDKRSVETIARWYRLPVAQALNTYRISRSFFSKIFDLVKPAAVISWQSANPMSRVVRSVSNERDIPWWCAERGWVRDTLMIDLCENNGMAEIDRSIGLHRALLHYSNSQATIQHLKNRLRSSGSPARYRNEQSNSFPINIRQQFGIPEKAKVVALFTHGEPHINTISGFYMQANHAMSQDLLQSRLREVALGLADRGAHLIIKEHPFNKPANRCLDLEGLPNTYRYDGNLQNILDTSDAFLFTLSTLQFEVGILGRPFGLLSRGMLSGNGEAPFIGDYPDCNSFFDAFLSTDCWTTRLPTIQRRIAFIFEHQLLDILGEDATSTSATELAEFLSRFAGGANMVGMADLYTFLNQGRG